jgi:hypothetical protein
MLDGKAVTKSFRRMLALSKVDGEGDLQLDSIHI